MSKAAMMLVTYPKKGMRQRFFQCQNVLDSWKATMSVFKQIGVVKDFTVCPLYALPPNVVVETR